MKIPVRIILLAILIIGMIPGVLADVTGANVSAYGGAMGFYSNESGNATLEVRTVIPLQNRQPPRMRCLRGARSPTNPASGAAAA